MRKASAYRGARLFGWQMDDGTCVPNYSVQARLLIRSPSSSYKKGFLMAITPQTSNPAQAAVLPKPEPKGTLDHLGAFVVNPGNYTPPGTMCQFSVGSLLQPCHAKEYNLPWTIKRGILGAALRQHWALPGEAGRRDVHLGGERRMGELADAHGRFVRKNKAVVV